MNRIRSFVAIVFCVLCAGVHAQWEWVDSGGRKVFSDRAPPPDVPQKNILKQPGAVAKAAVPQVASASDAPAKAASDAAGAAGEPGPETAVPKLSAVDKDLAERKKQAEAAVQAKARADEESAARAKADNCQRAMANKTLMESGARVTMTNAKGEREVIDDTGRAAELKRIKIVMDASCK